MFLVFPAISKERLKALAKLNIESDITQQIKYEDIIDDFADIQSRKKILKYTINIIILHIINCISFIIM